jgi:hypothetical protein
MRDIPITIKIGIGIITILAPGYHDSFSDIEATHQMQRGERSI